MSRDLSSPPEVVHGQGQVTHHFCASVSHWWRQQWNSKGPSNSDIVFPNIILVHSQATKNCSAQAIHTPDQQQSMKNLPAYNYLASFI